MTEALLVYKMANTGLPFIQDAIEFLRTKGLWVKARFEIDSTITYDAVFVLHPEKGGAYISKDQYDFVKDAESKNIPVFIIYQLKGSGEFQIYTGYIYEESNASGNCYAKMNNFIRVTDIQDRLNIPLPGTQKAPMPRIEEHTFSTEAVYARLEELIAEQELLLLIT